MNCRRFDIFLADLKDFGIEEEHYVLIISNWKNNIRKYLSVNVLFITSQLKSLSNHVNFDGKLFGLKKESQIKCEKIFTLEKDKLIKKVGNINDIWLQLNIEKALESQLQLDNKYLNQDTKQIEELFSKRVKSMNNIAKYENIRQEFMREAYKGNNSTCVGKCTELIEVLKNDKSELKDYYQCAYYHRALMFIKLKDFDNALNDAKESLRYTDNIKKEINNKYSYSIFVLARCYEELGMWEKSVDMYSMLSKYYRNIGKHNMRVIVLFNVAKYYNKKHIMKRLIKIVENMDFQEFETNKTKENILKDMHEELEYIS